MLSSPHRTFHQIDLNILSKRRRQTQQGVFLFLQIVFFFFYKMCFSFSFFSFPTKCFFFFIYTSEEITERVLGVPGQLLDSERPLFVLIVTRGRPALPACFNIFTFFFGSHSIQIFWFIPFILHFFGSHFIQNFRFIHFIIHYPFFSWTIITVVIHLWYSRSVLHRKKFLFFPHYFFYVNHYFFCI